MWPFRERTPSRAEPPAVASNASREWSATGPIQRAVTPLETTVETSSFEAGLASHRSPGFLQPLVHDRSDAGAGGVIRGLLTPVVGLPRQTSSGPELPMRAQRRMRLQRRSTAPAVTPVDDGPADLMEPGGEPAPRTLEPVPPAQVADRPAGQLTRSAASPDAPPPLYLPAVAPAGETPAPSPITSPSAAPELETASVESADSEVSVDTPALPAVTPAAAAAPAPASRVAEAARASAPVTPAPAVQRLPALDFPVPTAAPAATAGRPRRLGLGEPLHRAPGPMPLQRRSGQETSEVAGAPGPQTAEPPQPSTPAAPPAAPGPAPGPRSEAPAEDLHSARAHPDPPSTGPVMVSLLGGDPRVMATDPAPASAEEARTAGETVPMALHDPDVTSRSRATSASPDEVPAPPPGLAAPPANAVSASPTLGAVQLLGDLGHGPTPPSYAPAPALMQRSLAAPPPAPAPTPAAAPAASVTAAPPSVPAVSQPVEGAGPTSLPPSSAAPLLPVTSIIEPPAPVSRLATTAENQAPSSGVDPTAPLPLEMPLESSAIPSSGPREDPEVPAGSTGLTSAAPLTVQTAVAPPEPRDSPSGPADPQPQLLLQRTAVQRSSPALPAPVDRPPATARPGEMSSLTLQAQRRSPGPSGPAASTASAVDDVVRAAGPTSVAAAGSRPALPLLALQPLALATVRAGADLRHQTSTAPVGPAMASSDPVPPKPLQTPSAPLAQRLELATPPPPAPAPAWVDPAAAAVASGLATRSPDGSVVFTAPSDDVPVQRQAGATEAPAAAPSSAPVPAGGAAPAGGQTNDQIDELAKRVYDTIRQRLKAELRLDRERSGRLTDLSR